MELDLKATAELTDEEHHEGFARALATALGYVEAVAADDPGKGA